MDQFAHVPASVAFVPVQNMISSRLVDRNYFLMMMIDDDDNDND